VKFYNSARGYGFNIEEVSGTEFFVHHSDVADCADLAPCELVSFERGRKGLRICAVNVRPATIVVKPHSND
jgi:cold shock CspA family protein